MRRLAIGFALALSLASTVPANAYGPPFSWTGLYVGVNGGYSWGRASADASVSGTVNGVPFEESGSRSADINGWLGGGQIGYNLQSNGWVFGVEADFQWTGQSGGISECFDPVCVKATLDLDWFGTVRGRVGYRVFPDTLLYFTGGLAYGHLSANASASGIPVIGSASVSDSETRTGWVIGGGLEWALDRSWRVKAEYLYMDLGTMQSKFGPVSASTGGEFPIDVSASGIVRTDFTDQIVRVGLSYKFGEAGYAPLK
jgi:outer membrane immunogenic protein